MEHLASRTVSRTPLEMNGNEIRSQKKLSASERLNLLDLTSRPVCDMADL